jgi:hypothetical protein
VHHAHVLCGKARTSGPAGGGGKIRVKKNVDYIHLIINDKAIF